jgi:acid phosphatase type 7
MRKASWILPSLVCALSSMASAATLARAPYVQSVTQGTAVIAFRLDVSCAAAVQLTPPGGTPRSYPSSEAGTSHAVTLTELAAGVRYAYQVQACGQPLGSAMSFQTAPPPDRRPTHLAVLGDMGVGSSNQAQVVQQILGDRPEALLTVGDNAYSSGTAAEFESRFFQPMSGLLSQVALFPALGNHEYTTSDAQPYLEAFTLPTNNPQRSERYYSFNWGQVHVAVLDSSCAVGYSSSCTLEAQRAWLQADLAESRADWKLVVFHHPTYSSGEHGSQLTLRRSWGPVLEAGGVDLVLTGHDHNYERSRPMKNEVPVAAAPGSPTYLVVGNGGAVLRPFATAVPPWSAYRNATDYGYLDLRIEGGTLKGEMRTAAGQVADSFALTKTLPPLTSNPPVTGGADPQTPTTPLDPSSLEPSIPSSPDGSIIDGSGDNVGCGIAPANGVGHALWLLALLGSWILSNQRRRTLVKVRVPPKQPPHFTSNVTSSSRRSPSSRTFPMPGTNQ